MSQISRARRDQMALLLIDLQPQFINSMATDREPVLKRIEQLLIISHWFSLPVTATVEKPTETKGLIPDRFARLLPEDCVVHEKHHYDATKEPHFLEHLRSLDKRQIAVAGCETDVCILQSVLGLLALEFEVFLPVDCVFTSEPRPDAAIRRMIDAGAIPTTYKSLFYELLGTDESDLWHTKINDAVQRGFVPPESLPPLQSAGNECDELWDQTD